MSNKDNKLKAYVRYDGQNKLVASSLILQRFKPKVGDWVEVNESLCCNPVLPTPSSKRDVNRAFARYDGQNNVVPGSLIFNRFKPAVGKWIEIPMYKCCETPAPTICGAPYWINVWDRTLSTAQEIESTYVDSNCNIYSGGSSSINFNPYEATFYKYAPDGSQIWAVAYKPPIGNTYGNGNNMVVDADGGVYYTTEQTLFKLDSNGIMVWAINMPGGFNNYGVTVGNGAVYWMLKNGSNAYETSISKIDPLTGAVLIEKSFTIDSVYTSGSSYVQSVPLIDSEGNLVFGINTVKRVGVDYITDIFKCDADLNVIWTKAVGVGLSGDTDSTGMAIDAAGNIYGIGYYQNLYKIDKDGNLVWVTQADVEWKGLSVSSSGDVFLAGKGLTSNTEVSYAKLDTNGVFQWSTNISYSGVGSIALDVDGFNSNINAPTYIKDNVYTIPIDNYNVSLGEHIKMEVKLPLTQVVGVYGDYTFVDDTADFSFTPTTNTLVTINYTVADTTYITTNSTGTLGIPQVNTGTLTTTPIV